MLLFLDLRGLYCVEVGALIGVRRNTYPWFSGGGGGGHFHIHVYAYWICPNFETPLFSPKFPLQSISFSQITKTPLRSITILEFLPLRRPSFSTFLYLQAVPSPPTAGLLRPAQTRSVRPAPRGYSRPECQPDTSYNSALETPNFMLEPAPETRIFTLEPLQSPPFFTLPWHIPTKMWAECPPPPPPGVWPLKAFRWIYIII